VLLERREGVVVVQEQDVDAIGNILVSAPDGARIPLKQVASITTQTGAFIIYRENNQRYIPIKFSVRDRDLQSTVDEAQARLAKEVRLPDRYRMEWAGEYDQLKDEQARLMMVVPIGPPTVVRTDGNAVVSETSCGDPGCEPVVWNNP